MKKVKLISLAAALFLSVSTNVLAGQIPTGNNTNNVGTNTNNNTNKNNLSQKQKQDQRNNQVVNPVTNSNAESGATSSPRADINQQQVSSLSSYQVNSNHESTNFITNGGGTQIPGTSIYGDLAVINDNWDWGGGATNIVIKGGIRHTFGGKIKKLAERQTVLDNTARAVSICEAIGYFKGRVVIDFEANPELKPCEGILPTAFLAPPENPPVIDNPALLPPPPPSTPEVQKPLYNIEQGGNVQVGG